MEEQTKEQKPQVRNPFRSQLNDIVKQGQHPIPSQRLVDTAQQQRLRDQANQKIGFTSGLTHSWFVNAFRMANTKDQDRPFTDGIQDYQQPWFPDAQRRKQVMKQIGYNSKRYQALIRDTSSEEQFNKKLQIMKEQIDLQKSMSYADTANQLLYGIGTAVTDPLTYTPIGGAGFFARAGIGALSGAATSYMNEYTTGEDDDPLQSMAIGMAFGVGVQSLAKATPYAKDFFGDMGRRSKATIQSIAQNGQASPKMAKSAQGVIGAMNFMRQRVQKILPTFTAQGAAQRTLDSELKEFFSLSGSIQKGQRTVDPATGQVVYKQFTKEGFTAEQWRDMYIQKGRQVSQRYADTFDKVVKTNQVDPRELDYQIRRAQDGFKTPFDNDTEFRKLVTQKTAFYTQRGNQIDGQQLIPGTRKDYKEARKLSKTKLVGALQATGAKTVKEAKKILRKKVSNLLLMSVQDPKYRKMLMDHYQEQMARIHGTKVNGVWPKDFNKWLKQKAYKDALGYVDQNEGVKSGLMSSSNATHHDYQKQRTPWKDTIEDANGFSIARLMQDSVQLMNSYNHTTSADLAMSHVFGVKSYQQLTAKLDKALARQKQLQKPSGLIGGIFGDHYSTQRAAVKAVLQSFYGRMGADGIDGGSWAAALVDSVSNLTYFANNGYMGLLNHTETAVGVKAYGGSFVIKSIPGLQNRLSDWSKGGMKAQERQGIINHIFGKQMRRRGTWRQMEQANDTRFMGNKLKTKMVTATQWLAQQAPMSRYLNASTDSIVTQARSQMLGDLVRHSHGLTDKAPFLDSKTLKRLNISQDAFNRLTQAIKDGTTVTDGAITLTNKWGAVQDNLQNFMNLRRIGNYVANEVIQRDNLMDTFIWKGSKAAPMMKLLTQFKSFALRSYNKRFVKSLNRMEQGEGISEAITWCVSGALSTVGFAGQMALMTAGMTDEQKKKYFKNTLGEQNPDWTSMKTYTNLGVNGFMRTGGMSWASLYANSLGFRTGIKTTSGDEAYQRDQLGNFKLEDRIASNIPAFRTINSLVSVPRNSWDMINSNYINPDDYRDKDRQRYERSFYRNVKSTTPNMPVIQRHLLNLFSDQHIK